MKKKLFIILKSFFAFIMIFCLVIPSYATLASADGSAFITKSEYDSAFTDFKTRLTTLESGINTKIDSQVTSYLDRNGIWSGVKQEMSALSDRQTGSFCAPNVNSNGQRLMYNKTYIPKITKTGMLVGSWDWVSNSGQNNNDTRWGWNYSNSSAHFRADYNYFLVLSFEEYNSSGSLLNSPYSAIILQGLGGLNGDVSGNADGNVTAPIATTAILTPFQFFVTKNSKISWKITLYFNLYSSMTVRNQTASYIKVNLYDATVY